MSHSNRETLMETHIVPNGSIVWDWGCRSCLDPVVLYPVACGSLLSIWIIFSIVLHYCLIWTILSSTFRLPMSVYCSIIHACVKHRTHTYTHTFLYQYCILSGYQLLISHILRQAKYFRFYLGKIGYTWWWLVGKYLL